MTVRDGTVSLLPCPFCGCTDISLDDDGHSEWLKCDWCGAVGGVDPAPEFEGQSIAWHWNRRSVPSVPVAWLIDTVRHLQRAIMDDDEEVRERASIKVAALYAEAVAPYAAALAMVREAIGELFGPIASIESEDASLLRGPEPHHEAESQIAALQRVRAALPSPASKPEVTEAMVRKLVWEPRVPGGVYLKADTSIGGYTMSFDSPSAGGAVNLWMAGADVDDFTVHTTRAAAKAAAQSDFATRVLSAIEVSP